MTPAFCLIVNSVWGTNMWCEPAESMVEMDLNGDGVIYDRETNDSAAATSSENPAPEGGNSDE